MKQVIDYTIKDEFYITSGYGNRVINGTTEFHKGCDYASKAEPCNIYGMNDGKVTISQYSSSAGEYIQVHYPKMGVWVRYLHLAKRNVSVGDEVNESTILGIMGTTGQSTGKHLHLDINDGSGYINPGTFYPEEHGYGKEEVDPFPGVSDEELAARVWNGEFGNGTDRKNALGIRYESVQALVDQGVGKPTEPSTDILELVKKTIQGLFGNGQDRKNALGDDYEEVQRQVNLNYENGTTNLDNIKLY